MSSKIKVDTIENVAGSGNVSLGSGHNLVVPGTLDVTGAITGTSQTLNRANTDGELIGLQRGGSAIGSIGTANTDDLYILNGDTGLMFSGGSDMIIPRGTAGAARDNAINLGAASHRFKDLYLSGGAYIGGTGSANHLDDFEEGTFAVTLASDSGGSLPTFANTGYYVKVGKMVHIHAQVTISGSSSGGSNLHIPLPFTPTDTRGALTVGLNQPLGMQSSGEYLSIVVELNSAKGYVVSHAFGGGHTHLTFNNCGTGIFSFSGSFRVA